jgi:DNA-binding NtrC family response regulator
MSDPRSYNHLPGISSLLDAIAAPAILMDREYRICAANQAYREHFSGNSALLGRHCYEVSHGYKVPCDQAGETCPLQGCLRTGQRQRILHIHNTCQGKEHVDVELSPVRNDDGQIEFFVEIMSPVHTPDTPGSRPMLGFSQAYTDMLAMLSRAAPTEINVLLLGESGTGKELAARHIHQHSSRANKPFVTVECSGLTESLFESELFGHEKGAFTGATQRKPGLVEAARGGTLFLDEVGDIPLAMQVKLLRLIETGSYRPVGSVTLQQADFRLVCATHRQLTQMVDAGTFRQDLYYRISPFPILLPSLAERRADIVPLARKLLQQLSQERPHVLSAAACDWLEQQQFPGNIRELRNRLERATILCDDREIEPRHLTLPDALRPEATETPSHSATRIPTKRITGLATDPDQAMPLDQLEARYLLAITQQFDGDNTRLAKQLGISERTLYRKLANARASQTNNASDSSTD